MKVKYANQVAIGTITPTNAGDGQEYDSLESMFPSLDSADAIWVKNVVLNVDVESVDIAQKAGA